MGEGTEVQAFSGQPLTAHQHAIMKLAAGFLPQSDQLLAEKIYYIIREPLLNRLHKFHYECPQSATAKMIPDPCGVLKDDEVFCSFSEGFVDDETGLHIDRVVGEVCIVRHLVSRTIWCPADGCCQFRHPCTLPTDVRKLKVVDRPQLSGLRCDVRACQS